MRSINHCVVGCPGGQHSVFWDRVRITPEGNLFFAKSKGFQFEFRPKKSKIIWMRLIFFSKPNQCNLTPQTPYSEVFQAPSLRVYQVSKNPFVSGCHMIYLPHISWIVYLTHSLYYSLMSVWWPFHYSKHF